MLSYTDRRQKLTSTLILVMSPTRPAINIGRYRNLFLKLHTGNDHQDIATNTPLFGAVRFCPINRHGDLRQTLASEVKSATGPEST